MNRRYFVVSAAAFILLGFSGQGMSASVVRARLSMGAAINKAGRQRMLSQRMAKAWLMLGRGVQPERGEAILKQSMTLFESQLDELSGNLPDEAVRAALVDLTTQWQGYRKLLSATPSPETAQQLFWSNEKVLAAAHALTQEYERVSGSKTGQLINLAGRQRMLSQRVAKFFLFQQWGINVTQAQTEMGRAQDEFSHGLAQLLAAPQSTGRIHSELELTRQQWFLLQNAIRLGASDAARAASDVVTTSERILEQLDLVVTLYENLAVL